MYARFFKRVIDFLLSLAALVILFPLLLVLALIGAVAMKGNPFFTQMRPGKNERIFKLIKFRTMTNERDSSGNLLPDEKRLNKYGKFLRSTSLDELPELLNILVGDMAIVGPRPLLVKYLPLYNDFQKRRHEVRPGLTGYAQIHGRNSTTWEQRFEDDIKYVDNITLLGDIKIIFGTVGKVLKREGISQENNATMQEFTGTKNQKTVDVMKKLIIVGAGGHGRVAADIAAALNTYNEIAFLDDNPDKDVSPYKILGGVGDFGRFAQEYDFFVAIGANTLRKAVFARLARANASIATLVHPSAVIGGNVTVGRGTMVAPGAVLNNGACLGEGVIINTCASVDHDCTVGDYTHISVGAHIAGMVDIGKGNFICAGVTVINNVKICENCIIGAGATVVKDIDRSGLYVGTPAALKKTV